MSGQWTIENDTGADLTVRAPNGFAVELDANSADPRERFAYFAIRQQARDLDQLRADLDAAVAERERICAMYVESTERLCDDILALRTRAEQAESRLAAIEAAPVVASVGHGDYLHRHTANVPVGTLLIARPAKD